ncbi:hypothetical protein D0T50_02235 [Bacteroides sp. 214]|uniref:hypothetical protein n=1 Tax=Bacteroides sp. 214 TaxID=2302935 RepID=UPI0013D85CE9|nr:hypothetical protein [Bacteroides sp. 214]NDW11706.1 hypothetical protein [Bacteroides sp. 214]
MTTSPRAIAALLLITIFFTSCRTSKSLQQEIRGSLSHLYYELSTPEYLGEVKHNTHLSFIDNSNMDYYTTVKKKGVTLVPLLFFNYIGQSYKVQLGEGSLTSNYREFLSDALLAECNSSTCFNLLEDYDGLAADSCYTLNVRITQNRTSSGIRINETAFFNPFFLIDMALQTDNHIFSPFGGSKSHHVKSPTTNLSLHVELRKDNKCLFSKEYQLKRKYRSGKDIRDADIANGTCLDAMAENLSLATKEVVEIISQELHMFFLAQ